MTKATGDWGERMRNRDRAALLIPTALLALATSACSSFWPTSPKPADPTPTKDEVVDIATNVELTEDGTVTWTEGRMDTSTEGGPRVVPVTGTTSRTAEFATDVELLTPQGCTEPFGDLKLDADGIGQTPCTRETYQQVDHYAPRIWLDQDGRITRIADRYHP
jgi:hypothetical protein